MKLTLERQIGLLFTLLAGLLVVLGAVVLIDASNTAATFREIDRANRVLRTVEDLLVDMLNVQTSTRGFLLTGDENFLLHYKTGIEDLPRVFRELDEACAGHPRHPARVNAIREKQSALDKLLDERLALRRSAKFSLEAAAPNLRLGKALTDSMRADIAAIEEEERSLLEQHSLEAHRAASRLFIFMPTLGLLAIVAVSFAGYRAVREVRARAAAQRELQELNADLEKRVRARTLELSTTAQRLQLLSQRFLEVQESERRHLAQELHDEIGQSLTAVKITLQSLQRSVKDPLLADRLKGAVEVATSSLEQTRSLSLDLRPPMLDDLGLVSALRWLVSRQLPEVKVGLDETVDDARPSAPVEIACFRLAQEAMNNALRHAEATEIRIGLSRDGARLDLRVNDNGRGFDYAATRARALAEGLSLGLLGMEERATLAGGKLRVFSAPGQGTTIEVSFPNAFAE